MKYVYKENYPYPHVLVLDKEDEGKFLFSFDKYSALIGDGKPVLNKEVKSELDEMFGSTWDSGVGDIIHGVARSTIFFLCFARKQDAMAWRLAKE